MKSQRFLIVAACTAAVSLFAFTPLAMSQGLTPAVASRITLTINATSVVAANVTPGARVIFFAVGRETAGYTQRLYRWNQIVTDDDRDGTVTLPVANGVPMQSMWAAVDLSNRQFAVVIPGGEPEKIPAERAHLRHGHGGTVEQFGLDSRFLDLLYVSAAGEVCVWKDYDGSPTDVDGPNAITTVSISNAALPDPKSHRPSEFAPGGVLIAFDWLRMSAYAVRVDEQMIRSAE